MSALTKKGLLSQKRGPKPKEEPKAHQINYRLTDREFDALHSLITIEESCNILARDLLLKSLHDKGKI